MRSTLPAVAALLLGVALMLLGNGLQSTLLPLRAQIEEFDALSIGVLGSSYFLGFALGGLFGPRVVQRVGHIRTFAAMMAAASAVVLIHVLIIHPVAWWLLRVLSGACFAVLFIVIESWLNEKSTNQTRGAVFAIYAVISFGMLGVGQFLLLLGAPQSFELFLLSSILVSVAAVPVALTRAEQPAPVQSVEIRLAALYRASPVGFVGCFVVGAANGAFWSLAPVFAQRQEGGVETVAAFIGVAIVTGAAGQWPLGFLSDRMDRRYVIILAAAAAAVCGAIMALVELSGALTVLALAGLYGLFAFPLYSLSVAHVNDFVEPDRFVETASGLSLIWGAGAVIGPILGSAAITGMGAGGLFAVTAAVHAALLIFTLYRIRQRARPAEEDRGTFIDAIRVGQTVAAIDPLSDAPETASDKPAPDDVREAPPEPKP